MNVYLNIIFPITLKSIVTNISLISKSEFQTLISKSEFFCLFYVLQWTEKVMSLTTLCGIWIWFWKWTTNTDLVDSSPYHVFWKNSSMLLCDHFEKYNTISKKPSWTLKNIFKDVLVLKYQNLWVWLSLLKFKISEMVRESRIPLLGFCECSADYTVQWKLAKLSFRNPSLYPPQECSEL